MSPNASGKLISKIETVINQARQSSLVANTLSYTVNFGLQLVIQLGFFMLVSRTLGAEGYGIFVSITSVSIISGIVIGVGSEYLLVQRTAVDPSAFPRHLGHALIMMALTLPLVAVPTIVFLHYLVGEAIGLVPLIIISLTDLVFTRLIVLAGQAYMAFDKANKQLLINILMAASKLIFLAIAASLIKDLTITDWAWWFFASGVLSATFAAAMVLRDLGRPIFGILKNELRLGGLYCIEFLAIGGMKDLDKPVVVLALGPELGGQYAAGFRIIDAASAPVRAFLYATYTRHFRHATAGRESSYAFGLKLLPPAVGLALPVAIGLFIISDYIPLVLGDDFAGTSGVVKCLAFYPLLMGLSGIGADLLRAIGSQKTRMALLIASSIALIPMVWFGSKVGGLVGAALLRFVLQTLLSIMTWGAILITKKRGT